MRAVSLQISCSRIQQADINGMQQSEMTSPSGVPLATSDEEEEEADEQVEVDTASLADGLSSVVSGYSSLPSGLETPEALDLRKGKAAGQPHPSLFTPAPSPSQEAACWLCLFDPS